MMENYSVPAPQNLICPSGKLSDRELKLLAMFRDISHQQQDDILRVLEAFTQLSE
ncbi:hypothetical protein [Pseudomonas sp. AP19]|uniref:hypothetical protein n=1 Tax=Pseudomonas sp. AP19 TaxID=1535623 RepID=UPI0014954F09|nr:hypothetical protein [Pseudomonas sp. AP19]